MAQIIMASIVTLMWILAVTAAAMEAPKGVVCWRGTPEQQIAVTIPPMVTATRSVLSTFKKPA